MTTVYKTLSSIINNTSVYNVNKITFYTITEDNSLVIPDTNLFSIYRRYINNYVATYTVTEDQRKYYKYKPDILSRDIYGTPCLDWLILMLNDRECPSKFSIKSTIKLIPYSLLEGLYDTIITKSNERLTDNHDVYLSYTNS